MLEPSSTNSTAHQEYANTHIWKEKKKNLLVNQQEPVTQTSRNNTTTRQNKKTPRRPIRKRFEVQLNQSSKHQNQAIKWLENQTFFIRKKKGERKNYPEGQQQEHQKLKWTTTSKHKNGDKQKHYSNSSEKWEVRTNHKTSVRNQESLEHHNRKRLKTKQRNKPFVASLTWTLGQGQLLLLLVLVVVEVVVLVHGEKRNQRGRKMVFLEREKKGGGVKRRKREERQRPSWRCCCWWSSLAIFVKQVMFKPWIATVQSNGSHWWVMLCLFFLIYQQDYNTHAWVAQPSASSTTTDTTFSFLLCLIL